jgi:hypothetical protein
MPRLPPQGDLDRAPCIEPDTGFPDYVEIRLVWASNRDSSATARSYLVKADEFFGWGGHGAPMSGDLIIRHIDRLRRLGSPK